MYADHAVEPKLLQNIYIKDKRKRIQTQLYFITLFEIICFILKTF